MDPPRVEWTGWLFGGAVALAAVGALAATLGARTAGKSAAPDTLEAVARRAFSGAPWQWGLGIFLGVFGAAVVLSVFARALRRDAEEDGKQFTALSTEGIGAALTEVRARLAECELDHERGVSRAFDELLRGALRLVASDLHITPSARGVVLTYRVHGSLFEVGLLPKAFGPRLATRVKVLARLNTFERGPQDGRLRHRVGEEAVEARVSTLLVDQGERVVLRLVRSSLVVPPLGELGFPAELSTELEQLLALPQGMLFVSGPVGSGKTTTLYSALQHIATQRGKTTSLVTLEDPIELQLPFAAQTQIDARMGMSFAQTLRSILRQDPNVLMLGEIRDRETAEIATQAGLTGHLILTTLHVDRAAATFARLIEMDVEPFVLASVVRGALSQRLVRSLCTHCRKPGKVTSLEQDRMSRLGLEVPDVEYFTSVGCEFCDGQGFAGRLPIAELLVMTPELREAASGRQTTDRIDALARASGMLPLASAGLVRAVAGETTVGEVLRVVA